MQLILDINEGYEAQFIGVLQSLDRKFFKKVEIDKNSAFMQDKAYLEEALKSIDDGTAKMISEDEFRTSTDSVLAIAMLSSQVT